MRTPMLLLLAALLLPWRSAAAQAADPASADPAGPRRTAAVHPWPEAESPAPAEAPGPRRDRLAGAAYGLGIGALVGGLGFAAMNAAFSTGAAPGEYTVLSLMLGGVVGGAAGSLVGAVVGVPRRSAGEAEGAQVRLAPAVAQGSPAVSLSVGMAW